MKYVLLRTGKVEVLGPFSNIREAAEHMGERGLLGYQILPLKSPNPEADKPFPIREQTAEFFAQWALKFPWPSTRHDDITIGEFLVCAEKKFPVFFALFWDDDRGVWRFDFKYRTAIVKGLRSYFAENGITIGLKESLEAVKDYEQIKGEDKK